MTDELPPRLFLLEKDAVQLYLPGRSVICTKNSADMTQGYAPQDIHFRQVPAPALSPGMQEVWSERFEKYELAKKRPGKFLGMQRPSSTAGALGIEYFPSGFLDWKCTLPVGDEFDERIERESMRPPINIHHAPITADGQLIYVTRGTNRESWSHAVLGTHSWGTDIDKNYACAQVMDDLAAGQGHALFRQARDGLRREINPFADSGNADIPNTVLEEILRPEDVHVESATCLTLHIKPKDMGYHICFRAKLDMEAGELLERRNKHPMVGRISGYHAVPFTADSMARFFGEYHERLATSIEPTIIMACVQEFGEDFIKRLPYAACRGQK